MYSLLPSRQDLKVFALSLSVRSAFLGILLLVGLYGRPYDTGSLITALDCDGAAQQSLPGKNGLVRLAVWDSVFFARIAQCGYEYEQFHAFFPLLPILLKTAGTLGYQAGLSAPSEHSLVLAGMLFSTLASAVSCVLLFRLTNSMYNDSRIAALAAILFFCNPASVFHSAVYSESLFAVLSFSALAVLRSHPLVAAALFGLSTATRSNGIVSGIFVGHEGLRRLCSLQGRSKTSLGVIAIVLQTALGGLLVAAPLLAFQYYGFRQFCGSQGEQPPWCSARLPYLYGHVQSHYWGVGFLRYFQLQQAPNFALAAPVLLLSIWGCWRFINDHGAGACARASFLPETGSAKAGALPDAVFPIQAAAHIAHWGFLAAFALLCMHVQVATRLLSTCPPLYWCAAQLCLRQGRSRLVWTYFLAYTALGYILFPQFYPWT